MFRTATSPKVLGWPPQQFWSATFPEFEMAMQGLAGKFQSGPIISRDDMAFLAKAHGKRPSIKK